MKGLKTKHCPRCGMKVFAESGVCPKCELKFEKFESATNKEAKLAIRAGEKDRVIMRKGLPSDVSKIKLLLITIFFGYTGAHLYMVGRYGKGLFYSIFFVIGIVNAVLSRFEFGKNDIIEIFYFLVLFWGAVLIMWIIDIANILLNKFKVPVSRQ